MSLIKCHNLYTKRLYTQHAIQSAYTLRIRDVTRANSAHAYFAVFFPGLSDFVGSVFCLSLQVFLWHVSAVPVVFFVPASADVQLAPS